MVCSQKKRNVHIGLRSKITNWNLAARFGKRAVRRLAPRVYEGVSPVRTLVTGGARHPYIFHKMAQRTRTATQKDTFVLRSAAGNSYSPRHQFENWWHPPHKCGGQGRVPHLPAHHSPNSLTNSNLSNHRTIPSGAGQERPHIFSARLGRPPCGPNSNLSFS